MEIEHFSHTHRLILEKKEEEEEEEQIYHIHDANFLEIRRCNGCQDPIFPSEAYYRCTESECIFFLHKICAELPREVDHHPEHPDHKLILDLSYMYRCAVCGRKCFSDIFSYSCSSECYFKMEVNCANLKDRKINHKSHKHPLVRLRKTGLFECDACRTKHEGFFYHCPTCLAFFIHEDCATLPRAIKHSDHDDHPLILAYSLPSRYSKFFTYCDICDKRVAYGEGWVYYCGMCRYFAHVNCATSKILPRRTSKVTIEQAKDSGVDVIRFPVVDQSVTLISYILTGTSATSNETANQGIHHHFSHDHPLILDVQGIDNESCLERRLLNDTRVDETICNACVKPIFATPYYKCADRCNFFLHKCCAELPTKIQHPSHPQHPLILLPKSPYFFNIFVCVGCDLPCNGFTYNCTLCDFNLDVHCGSLPKHIKHEAHHPNHVLSLKLKQHTRCRACHIVARSEHILAYCCNSCDFDIDSICVLLSRKVRHRYDEHPFILTYHPVKDHSDDYYCDLCEEEMNPKCWFYHCVDCDRSIHTKCLRPFYSWSNMKYGRSLNSKRHQHPLALAPVVHQDTKINNSFRVIVREQDCNNCRSRFSTGSIGQYYGRSFGFKCMQCNFMQCYWCAAERHQDK